MGKKRGTGSSGDGSISDSDRLAALQRYNSRCSICGTSALDELIRVIHLDGAHRTICSRCYAGMSAGKASSTANLELSFGSGPGDILDVERAWDERGIPDSYRS